MAEPPALFERGLEGRKGRDEWQGEYQLGSSLSVCLSVCSSVFLSTRPPVLAATRNGIKSCQERQNVPRIAFHSISVVVSNCLKQQLGEGRVCLFVCLFIC